MAQENRFSILHGKDERKLPKLRQIRRVAAYNCIAAAAPFRVIQQIAVSQQAVLHAVLRLFAEIYPDDAVEPRQRAILYAAWDCRICFAVKIPRSCKPFVRQVFNLKMRPDLRFHIRFCHIALFLQRIHIPSENPHQIFRGRCRRRPA